MFVFGEIQDPNQETVNLVEDIVRSQIIELVRPLYRLYCEIHVPVIYRSSRRVPLQTAEEHGT